MTGLTNVTINHLKNSKVKSGEGCVAGEDFFEDGAVIGAADAVFDADSNHVKIGGICIVTFDGFTIQTLSSMTGLTNVTILSIDTEDFANSNQVSKEQDWNSRQIKSKTSMGRRAIRVNKDRTTTRLMTGLTHMTILSIDT